MPKDFSTTVKDQGFASPDTESSTYRKTDEELATARQRFLGRIAIQRSRNKLKGLERNPYREKHRRFSAETD